MDPLIISIIAIVVSFSALIVTIWESIEIRRNNRLTVIPKLTFITSLSGIEHFIGIQVKNNGFGLAIIKKFSIFVDEKLLSTESNAGWNKAFTKLGLKKIEVVWGEWEPNDASGVGNIQNILIINESVLTPEKRKIFMSAIKRLKISIEYESIYGECFLSEWKYSENIAD